MSSLPLPGIAVPASPLALGTMLHGSSLPRDEAFALLDRYHAAGGTVLDTANAYAEWLPDGAGRSEVVVGEWIRSRGVRDRVLLATKGGHPERPSRRSRLRPELLTRDLEQSLDRLGLESVDLYWFHRDDPAVPVGELLGWAHAARRSGRIRALGASNWSGPRLREAAAWAARHERAGFAASQVGWSLAELRPGSLPDPTLVHLDDALLADHAALALPVFAYQAQARGWFAPAKREDPALLTRYDTPRNRRRLALVDALARRHDATPNQIALAWFRHQPVPAIPIIGPRTPEQLADALGSLAITLSPAECDLLSQAAPVSALPTGLRS